MPTKLSASPVLSWPALLVWRSFVMVLHACCSWHVGLVLVGPDLMLPRWPWGSLTRECLPCRVSLVFHMLGAYCGLVLLPWSLLLGL